jgi:prepilin-type N-terminal cleavage/methylation domain-containing protein
MVILTKTQRKGFTLIELIVVIAIIAVLAGVVMVILNPAAILEKARDTKRMEDLDTLNKVIHLAVLDEEIALQNTSGVCPTCRSNALPSPEIQDIGGVTGWVKYETIGDIGLGKFLPALPVDPLNNDDYHYSFASTETGWEINAKLESPDNQYAMETDGGDDPNMYEMGTNLRIISPLAP